MEQNQTKLTGAPAPMQHTGAAVRPSATQLRQLPPAPLTNCADQCRALGLKVGDVIVGREGRYVWRDARLELVWLGETAALFVHSTRTSHEPTWQVKGETANWTLAARDWCLAPPECLEAGGPAPDDPLLAGELAAALAPASPAPADAARAGAGAAYAGAGGERDTAVQQMAGEIAALRKFLQQICAVPPVGQPDASLDGKRAQVCQELARQALADSGRHLSAPLLQQMLQQLGPRAARGAFWTDVVKDGGAWRYTLRTRGDWPNPAGIEVARLNPHVMALYPGLGEKIAQACTSFDAAIEALQLVLEHCAPPRASFDEMPVDSTWLSQTAAEALEAAGVRPREPAEAATARPPRVRHRP